MEKMDYHPNMLARSLVNKSTNIIGVVLPGSSEDVYKHPFFPEILRGITTKANKYNYNILIANSDSSRKEAAILNDFVNGGITAGVILLSSRVNDESIENMISSGFAFVMVGRPDDDKTDKFSWVDNDNFDAGYKLTKHFLKKGYKSVAFIGVSDEYMVTVDRLNGYKKALSEAGIEFDDQLVVKSSFMDNNGASLVKVLLKRKKQFDGIIAGDDFQAFSAMNYLMKNGYKIPQDVAIAGFNNVPLSNFSSPSLTSIEVNASSLGEKAFDLLYNSIKSETPEIQSEFVSTELVERKSC